MQEEAEAARPALEGLATPETMRELGREALERLGQAYRLAEIQAQLKALTFSSPPERSQLVRLLTTLQALLGPTLDTRHALPDGAEWVDMHPTTEALGFLADALKDLDNGVAHPTLRPVPIGGAMKPTAEHKLTQKAVEWVEIVAAMQDIPRKAACKQVASAISKMGVRIGKKPIDAKRLEGWCAGRRPGIKR